MSFNAILKTCGIRSRIYQTNPLALDPRGQNLTLADEGFGPFRYLCNKFALCDDPVQRRHIPLGWVRNHPMNHGFDPGRIISCDANDVYLCLMTGPPGTSKSMNMQGKINRSIDIASDTDNRSVHVILGKPDRYQINATTLYGLRAGLKVTTVDNTGKTELGPDDHPRDNYGQTAVYNKFDQRLRDLLSPQHFGDLLLRCYGQIRQVGEYGQDFFSTEMAHALVRAMLLLGFTTPDEKELLKVILDEDYAQQKLAISVREIPNTRHALINLENEACNYSGVVSRDKHKGLPQHVIDGRVDWLDVIDAPKQLIILNQESNTEGTLNTVSYLEGLLKARQYLGNRRDPVVHDIYIDDTTLPPKSLAKLIARSRDAKLRLTIATQSISQIDKSVRQTVAGMVNVTQDFGSDADKEQQEFLIDNSRDIQIANPHFDAAGLLTGCGIREVPLLHKDIFKAVRKDHNTSLVRINISGHPLSGETLLLQSPPYYPYSVLRLLAKLDIPKLPGHFHPREFKSVVNKNALKEALDELEATRKKETNERNGSRTNHDKAKESRAERQQEELLMRLMTQMNETNTELLKGLGKVLGDFVKANGQHAPTNGAQKNKSRTTKTQPRTRKANKTTDRTPRQKQASSQAKTKRRLNLSLKDIDPNINTESRVDDRRTKKREK